MKARIRKTGEICNIADCATIALDDYDSRGNPIEIKPEDVELIQEQTEDEHCQNLRERAAVAAMQGIVLALSTDDEIPEKSPNEIADFTVACANSLIKELKKNYENN